MASGSRPWTHDYVMSRDFVQVDSAGTWIDLHVSLRRYIMGVREVIGETSNEGTRSPLVFRFASGSNT